MAFKKINIDNISIDSPESLLHDLRYKKIPGPISHQSDIWRYYQENAIDKKDVAIQLPTGSGKTLVGLILGEWRRKKFNEKIVYLCPTIQLVNQVVDLAQNKYGLKVNSYIGSKKDFSNEIKAEYQLNEKMAITTYSALFNTKPFFSNPDILILDDAHTSDNYICNLWELKIQKNDYPDLFKIIIICLKNFLSENSLEILNADDDDNDNYYSGSVDKIPTNLLIEIKDELREILNEYCQSTDLYYSWSIIKDNLLACHFYFNSKGILIRPLIPPTNSHPPFEKAKQRIYISATLGNSGELERLVGREKIFRIPIPKGWDKQGIGRRFFIFPEISKQEQPKNKFIKIFCNHVNRSVILVPSDLLAEEIKDELSDITIYTGKMLETSKSDFEKCEKAIALLSNRYDGIDFPDDVSHLLIINELSIINNLQEQFLMSRMGAHILYNEKILSRFIQSIGRCTRSATDYSAIIIYGEKILSYIFSKKNRAILHPELQAEIEFGIQQSKDVSSHELIENFDLFLSQSDNWNDADSQIINLRDNITQIISSDIQILKDCADIEVQYQYELWQGNYINAFNLAREIITKLTGEDLKGYRVLWNYLAGSACLLAAKYCGNIEEYRTLAKDYFNNSLKGTIGLKWLVEITRNVVVNNSNMLEEELIEVIENLEKKIISLGTLKDREYIKEEKYILENIQKTKKEDSALFEEAQKRIGNLIGFIADNKETTGAPDPWWKLTNNLYIVFEDHSGAESDTLHVDKARQVFCHDNWLRENLELNESVEIIKILVSPVTKVDKDALPHLKDVYLWSLKEFQEWVINALSVIRKLRGSFTIAGDLVWKENAIQQYNVNNMSPKQIINFIKKNKAKEKLECTNK